jgi:hypothetical protein
VKVGSASLVVALLLLASVGTASAECAWVLWFQVSVRATVPPTERMDPIATYLTKGECEETADRWLARDKANKKPGVDQIYVCFPDTTDPRGPNAK